VNLDDQSISIIKATKTTTTKDMESADNKLTTIKFIAENLSNIYRLQLKRIRVENIGGVTKLTQIAILNLRDNRFALQPE
jgi:ribosome recycling factor